jgi:hypothetical protein
VSIPGTLGGTAAVILGARLLRTVSKDPDEANVPVSGNRDDRCLDGCTPDTGVSHASFRCVVSAMERGQ